LHQFIMYQARMLGKYRELNCSVDTKYLCTNGYIAKTGRDATIMIAYLSNSAMPISAWLSSLANNCS
jgi:hypothetical protein